MSDVTSTAQLDTPQQTAVAAALVVLERMGLSPADLVAAPTAGRRCRRSPSTSRWCRRR